VQTATVENDAIVFILIYIITRIVINWTNHRRS
jgi:hypothetical protein